jgi:hypothetical protein
LTVAVELTGVVDKVESPATTPTDRAKNSQADM